MKYKLIMAFMIMTNMVLAEKANQYRVVYTDNSGSAVQVGEVYTGKPHTLKDNEYSFSTWQSFGITNDITGSYPYIIKDGNVWRDMNQAEKDASDSNIQQEVTDETTSDPQLDAILHTIAKAIDGNVKTYDGVKALFEGSVDPKKAKKKEK